MSRRLLILVACILLSYCLNAQSFLSEQMPVRGFSIAAPQALSVDKFVSFILEELAGREINVLILRVDYNY